MFDVEVKRGDQRIVKVVLSAVPLLFLALLLALAAPVLSTIADESTPTPGSQDPNFPMTEVPQKKSASPMPASQQPLYDSAVQLTQDDEFQREIDAKLKLLGLKPIYYGALWDKNRVVIRVAVENKVTPELTSKFDRLTYGMGGNIPVQLVQGHPLFGSGNLLKRSTTEPGGDMNTVHGPADVGLPPYKPIPADQQAELDNCAAITSAPGFDADMMARLKHLNLTLVGYGPALHNGNAVIFVEVEQKVTPELREQFDQEMQGIGQGYPVLLKHGERGHLLIQSSH